MYLLGLGLGVRCRAVFSSLSTFPQTSNAAFSVRGGGGGIRVCCCLHLPEKVCVPSSLKSAESYWRGALQKMVCQNKNGIEIDLGGIHAGGRCQKAAALVTGDSGSRDSVWSWHADQNRQSELPRLVMCVLSCV